MERKKDTKYGLKVDLCDNYYAAVYRNWLIVSVKIFISNQNVLTQVFID